jgi:hypothetical protein
MKAPRDVIEMSCEDFCLLYLFESKIDKQDYLHIEGNVTILVKEDRFEKYFSTIIVLK